jgi:hypothetical protein
MRRTSQQHSLAQAISLLPNRAHDMGKSYNDGIAMSDVQITTIARKSVTRRTPHNHVRNVLLISTGILTLLVASSLLCFGGLKPMGRYICGERFFFAETIKRLKAQTHSQLVEVDFQLYNFITCLKIRILSLRVVCS